ncbi:MAG: MBL fold metallo-hydrolase [Oscillospiraceae bacterium]|nr:MBL fold metallo-hydrolase [Oscillospiraceae bacterium]
MITYTCIPVGLLQSNSYLLREEATGALALVDCGFFNRPVADAIREQGGDLRYLLLTHGHFDHIQGAADCKAAYPTAQVAVSVADAAYLRGEIDAVPGRRSRYKIAMEPDWLLREGDEIPLGESALRVIETPGHTLGGVCFFAAQERLLLTGDTLFFEEVGRHDLTGGDWPTLQASLARLIAIEGDAVVLPGHGQASSLAHERAHNPYL